MTCPKERFASVHGYLEMRFTLLSVVPKLGGLSKSTSFLISALSCPVLFYPPIAISMFVSYWTHQWHTNALYVDTSHQRSEVYGGRQCFTLEESTAWGREKEKRATTTTTDWWRHECRKRAILSTHYILDTFPTWPAYGGRPKCWNEMRPVSY